MKNPTRKSDQFHSIAQYVGKEGLPSVSLLSYTGSGAFEILVSTVLSARTRDPVTLSATEKLFLNLATENEQTQIRSLSQLDIASIQELIYPVAFFRQKAKALKELALDLLENKASRVPDTITELVALPGVGIKTASLVLGLAFGKPAICVDVHVQRIAFRLGWTIKLEKTGTPKMPDVETTRVQLEESFDPEDWIAINTVFVRFGQLVCTPQSPKCSLCPVSENCAKNGVTRSR